MRLQLRRALHLSSSVLAIGIASCSQPRANDPRLEWAYTVGVAAQAKPVDANALPIVEAKAEDATMAAVVRNVAQQASISVVYPPAFEKDTFTGDLKGPADAVLDAIARRADLRFQWSNGVGIIGKPLPEDRSVAVVRASVPDPDKVIQPLLSETGKVTQSGGVILITDRSETVQRVVRALDQVSPTSFAVQLLEIVTSRGFELSGTLAYPSLTLHRSSLDHLLDTQITGALLSDDGYLGRTWTAVAAEGLAADYFVGETTRLPVTTVNERYSSTDVRSEQTGWKLHLLITNHHLAGTITQDGVSVTNYRIDFALPSPGLYLVHASELSKRDTDPGLPSIRFSRHRLRRYVWLRYLPLGTLRAGMPEVGSDALDRPTPEQMAAPSIEKR